MVRRYLEDAGRDVRAGLRALRREATLSAAVLLTIALGLGATTAILSVVRAALLQPLPYEDAGRLLHVWEQTAGTGERGRTSLPVLLDWRVRTTAFTGLEAYDPTNVTARIGDEAEMLRGGRVTPGFFALLGVQAVRGRTSLDPGEGAAPVVVSHALAARIGDVRSALGRPLVLNGGTHTVVGVLPPGFHFAALEDADVWLPIEPSEAQRSDGANRWLSVIGRMRNGVDLADARRDLTRVSAGIEAERPADMAGRTVALAPLRDAFLGDVKPILTSLSAAVALLLVITVANLGGLTLLRDLDRRHELALRAALGASRGRLVRQLFAEGLVLALGGAVLSVYVGAIGVRLMLAAIPDGLRVGMPYLADVRVDGATVALVLALATAMAVAFSLGPAWRAVRTMAPVGHGTRLTVGKGDRRFRRVLVVGQLGLAMTLLTGTAQIAGSFLRLLAQDIGVAEPDRLLTLNVAASGPAYPDAAALQGLYEELLTRAAALPGVVAAAAVNELPLSGSGMTTFELADRPVLPGRRAPVALRIVAGDYFTALGIPIRNGRALGPVDRGGATPAMVVSASLAERLAADGAVLGRRVRLTRTGGTPWEVVGVAADVRMGRLDAEQPPAVYVSHLQAAENRLPLVVRTSVPPATVAASLRELVRGIDPAVPVYAVATLGQQMRRSGPVFARRFPLVIGGTFAAAALLLALVGLYSLLAHEVLSRRRELTLRLVLGASPAQVRMGVLRDGLALALLGVGGGLLAAVPASQLVRSLLFGVRPVDPFIYGGAALGVLAAATLATALPAWRGSRADLAGALRLD